MNRLHQKIMSTLGKVAYHQGLELKPNYARSWSNMAIAHANLGAAPSSPCIALAEAV